MDPAAAQRFADSWYAAWSSHDLEAILAHYSAYFAAGLEEYPDLRFEPLELFVGVDSLVLGDVSANGRPAAEAVFLDGEGRIARYVAHYA